MLKSGGFNALRVGLIVVAAISLGLVVVLAVVSPVQHRASQVRLFNQLRSELALGTAPRGPLALPTAVTPPVGPGTTGPAAPTAPPKPRPIAQGTPIALLRIPAIGVSQVVVEGTSGSDLAQGPGHDVASVFPGGTGTSIILGRAAAYGGPFAELHQLRPGDRITVITQVGTAEFRVVDVRHAGTRGKPYAADSSRLTLGTASGGAFIPSGVLWVDADKVGPPFAAQLPLVHTVPADQRPLAGDPGAWLPLLLWTAAMVVMVIGALWTWRRRGAAPAWIVFFAPVALFAVLAANEVARLLPNLL